MNAVLSIPTPFVSVPEFARLTGQTEATVKTQITKNQLPVYRLPPASDVKDPTKQERSKPFIDMAVLQIEAMKRAGLEVSLLQN